MKRKPKAAKNDFTKAMLPKNRKEVFFDVVKLQWQSLLLQGLILLLFYLPLLLSTAVKDIYIATAYATEGAQAAQNTVMLELLLSFVNIPLLAIFAVGVSGVLRTVRQYAWGENVHLSTDFSKGIRDNYGQTAAIGMLAGLIFALCLTVYYSAAAYASPVMGAVSLLPIALSALVAAPILAIALAMVPVYSNKLWATVKNAFVVYLHDLPKVLGSALLCLLPWCIAIVPDFYCHILGSAAAVLLMPFSLLAWTLLCYNRFDRHINPLVSPQLIRKGIYNETD